MDSDHFDDLTRIMANLFSRRALAVTIGVAAIGLGDVSDAKRKKRKKRKKKRKNNEQKVIFNDFGCVNVGNFCQNADQCCSNICEGNECRAHDADVCSNGAADNFCGGANSVCLTPGDNVGLCNSTTGNAGFCTGDRKCFACTKDSDCTAECGLDAACIVCATCDETGGTACGGSTPGSCL